MKWIIFQEKNHQKLNKEGAENHSTLILSMKLKISVKEKPNIIAIIAITTKLDQL